MIDRAKAMKWFALAIGTLLPACGAPTVRQTPTTVGPRNTQTQWVYVTIDANTEPASLVALDDDEHPLCVAPCNRKVQVASRKHYRIIAPTMDPTPPFKLYSPQDPVVWLDYRATTTTTINALRATFLATIITGGALTLVGMIATPLADDKRLQTGFSATGFAGVVLLLPVSTIIGAISSNSGSSATFRDPQTRADLQRMTR